MTEKDAKKINEAQQHLAMARVVLKRMTPAGKEELTARLGMNVDDVINEIMKSGDKLADMYLEWSREK